MPGGTGSEAPLQETATEVLEDSGKETPSQPKSFDELRGGNRSAFEQSEEEQALEKTLEETLEEEVTDPETPEQTPEEKKPGEESGKEKKEPETPPGGKKSEGEGEPEKPTDTQTEDGYVAEVQLIVDGKPVKTSIEQLYENAEVDLFTPAGGTTTIKGLEPLRVLAQKGLYSDERNALANRTMEEAKNLRATFQQTVVQEAQKIANGYLQDWMEKNLTGGQVDPNNPLSAAPVQEPNQSTSLANQYLLLELQKVRKAQEDFQNRQVQERQQFQAQQEQQEREAAGKNIAETTIMPFRDKFKAADGSYDDEAFSYFADMAANRTVFRVGQINAERKAADPTYTGMSKEEVATITAQIAREVYQLDQKRVQKLIDTRLATMKRTARTGGPRGGGGAPVETVEEQPEPKGGKKTWDSLRQRRPG